ncbi:hypothetical protein [Stenotrophomonas phage SOVA965]
MKVDFSYKNGRVRAMSERDARILSKLGHGSYMTRDMRAQTSVSTTNSDELAELRAKYQEVVGKKAYHGWDAEELAQKIAEHGE